LRLTRPRKKSSKALAKPAARPSQPARASNTNIRLSFREETLATGTSSGCPGFFERGLLVATAQCWWRNRCDGRRPILHIGTWRRLDDRQITIARRARGHFAAAKLLRPSHPIRPPGTTELLCSC